MLLERIGKVNLYDSNYSFKYSNFGMSILRGDLSNYWAWSKSDAYMPAGALLFNITDMTQYVEMQINENPDYLFKAHDSLAEVNSSTSSYEKMGIRIDDFGLGWVIDNEKRLFGIMVEWIAIIVTLDLIKKSKS